VRALLSAAIVADFRFPESSRQTPSRPGWHTNSKRYSLKLWRTWLLLGVDLSIREQWNVLGPGVLLAATSIGASHLVFSPRPAHYLATNGSGWSWSATCSNTRQKSMPTNYCPRPRPASLPSVPPRPCEQLPGRTVLVVSRFCRLFHDADFVIGQAVGDVVICRRFPHCHLTSNHNTPQIFPFELDRQSALW